MLRLVLFFIVVVIGVDSLSVFLRSYDRLRYDCAALHRRARRAVEDGSASSNGVAIKFSALGRYEPIYDASSSIKIYTRIFFYRDFRLKLYPDSSAFTPDHVLTDAVGKVIPFDLSSILVDGYAIGRRHDSHLHGSLRDGLFEGKIYLGNESFVVEPARRFVFGAGKRKILNIVLTVPSRYSGDAKDFHSIIYSEHDVIHPSELHHRDETNGSACGLSDSNAHRMLVLQQSAIVNNADAVCVDCSSRRPSDSFLVRHTIDRRKRSSTTDNVADRKRVCRMYIQTDSFLWDHVIKTEKTPARARDEILSMIAGHVKAISAIYQSYDFNGIRGIKFAVQRTTVSVCLSGSSLTGAAPLEKFRGRFVAL